MLHMAPLAGVVTSVDDRTQLGMITLFAARRTTIDTEESAAIDSVPGVARE